MSKRHSIFLNNCHRAFHCLTSWDPLYSSVGMILKVKYFYREQSVFMSRLHKMVLTSLLMSGIRNCVMHFHYSASEICTPIWLKEHGDAMVLPFGFTNNYEQSQKLHLCSHIRVFIKDCNRTLSSKIRLFTYTATLTKPTWPNHFVVLYFRCLKYSPYKPRSVFDTTTMVCYVFIS